MTEIQGLTISCAIEAPIAALLVRLTQWPSRGSLHAGGAAAAATAVTHPQFWAAALWAFPRFAYWPSLMILETAVVLVEGVLIGWIANLRIDRAMLVSLVANSASCLVGVWLER